MAETYRATAGLSAEDAAGFAEAVARLTERHGGATPGMVVDAARPADSPIHHLFEWDDLAAAEAWRREQAGLYLRTVEVVRRGSGGADVWIRAFHSVRVLPSGEPAPVDQPSEGERRYVTLQRVEECPPFLDQVIADAERLIAQLRRQLVKYRGMAGMERFAPLLEAIEAAS